MRRNGWRLFAGAAVAVILAAQPAAADDADTCSTKALSLDEVIAACTRLITSDRYNGPDLAIIYTNRGDAWRVKGDANRAVADYGQAIEIDPQYATAYINRGDAWRGKGDN